MHKKPSALYSLSCARQILSIEKAKNRFFIWFFAYLFVPLHPLFGVIAGRKHRVACYVALERYNNQLIT